MGIHSALNDHSHDIENNPIQPQHIEIANESMLEKSSF